jgi:hypothetical protein
MALSGYAERDNRHALTCFKVVSKSQASKYRNIFNCRVQIILYLVDINFVKYERIVFIVNNNLTMLQKTVDSFIMYFALVE